MPLQVTPWRVDQILQHAFDARDRKEYQNSQLAQQDVDNERRNRMLALQEQKFDNDMQSTDLERASKLAEKEKTDMQFHNIAGKIYTKNNYNHDATQKELKALFGDNPEIDKIKFTPDGTFYDTGNGIEFRDWVKGDVKFLPKEKANKEILKQFITKDNRVVYLTDEEAKAQRNKLGGGRYKESEGGGSGESKKSDSKKEKSIKNKLAELEKFRKLHKDKLEAGGEEAIAALKARLNNGEDIPNCLILQT